VVTSFLNSMTRSGRLSAPAGRRYALATKPAATETVVINQPIDDVCAAFGVLVDRSPGRAPSGEFEADPTLHRTGRFAGRWVELKFTFYAIPGGTQVTAVADVIDGQGGVRSALSSAAARRYLASHLRGMKDALE
jgi:hypothetical protein